MAKSLSEIDRNETWQQHCDQGVIRFHSYFKVTGFNANRFNLSELAGTTLREVMKQFYYLGNPNHSAGFKKGYDL